MKNRILFVDDEENVLGTSSVFDEFFGRERLRLLRRFASRNNIRRFGPGVVEVNQG